MKQTQRSSTWDEQETQNFLRAYCEDPNNWQIIASKVGTRTPYQVMRFAKKYFNMIQRDEQIRRNNRSIRDYRYCKHNRPAPPGMQIVSSKIKAIKKILREKPELTRLEEAALKAYQDARTNREAMRLGLEPQPDESQRPKRARTARRPQEPGRVGRSLGPRPRSRHDDYKEVRDAESEDQGLFERYRPSRMQARMSIDEEGEERDDDDA